MKTTNPATTKIFAHNVCRAAAIIVLMGFAALLFAQTSADSLKQPTWDDHEDASWLTRDLWQVDLIAQQKEGAVRPTETGYLTVADGVEIYYERYGTGTPNVFISNRQEVHLTMAPILESHNVVTWDPRGRGRSSRPDDLSLYTADTDIADTEALRRHFGADRISYIGISLWGSMGALYAARHPESVAQIVMLGPLPIEQRYFDIVDNPPVYDLSEEEAILEQMEADGVRESDPRAFCQQQWTLFGADSYYDRANMENLINSDMCNSENEFIENVGAVAFDGIITSFGDWNWTGEAAEVEAQALLIFGEHEWWSREGVRTWATHISDIGVMELERAAHHVWNDRADVVLPAIDQFLRGEWPEAAAR